MIAGLMSVLLLIISLPGCGTNCNQNAGFAIEVSLRDGDTKAILCDGHVIATTTDGFREDLTRWTTDAGEFACFFYGGSERPGTYSLDITAPGYLPQQRANIVVPRRDDACGTLETRTVIVELEPDPNAPRPIGDAGVDGG